MSIETILNRISDDAEEAARKVIKEGEAEAARIKQAYLSKAAALEKELQIEAEKKGAEEEKRLIVSERLELRKSALAGRREILEGIYEEARKKIEAIEGEEYLELVGGLIAGQAVSGSEEIVPAKGQRGLYSKSFIDSLNGRFPGVGRFVLAGEEGSFSWGIMLREGKRVVDLSLDVVFEQLKEKVEPGIAALLFGGDR